MLCEGKNIFEKKFVDEKPPVQGEVLGGKPTPYD